jgi:hypothetical protein
VFQQLTVPQIADRWRNYGRTRARFPSLWDGSLRLATLGPQALAEGTKARDFSGRNNHGTLTGATHLPTWGNWSYRGQPFRALTCDGTEDCITYQNDIFNALTLGTVSAWIYPVATAAPVNVLLTGASGTNLGWAPIQWVKGIQAVYTQSFSGFWNEAFIGPANSVLPGQWTHVAVTSNGSVWAQFVNGKSVALSSIVGTNNGRWAAATATGATAYKIGYLNTQYPYWWLGSFADVRLYSRQLSASEISILARHPLAPYEVRLPEYFTFTSTPSAAKYWMWARQQRSQVIGGGIT